MAKRNAELEENLEAAMETYAELMEAARGNGQGTKLGTAEIRSNKSSGEDRM